MYLNPVSEEFDRAYANVGLLASGIWNFKSELSDYKRSNLYLWIRFNETEQRFVLEEPGDNKSISTEDTPKFNFSRTIPLSQPSFYDNGEIPKMFGDCSQNEVVQCPQEIPQGDSSENLEPWMLPEVEQELNQFICGYSSRWQLPSPRISVGQDLAPAKQLATVSPSKWLSRTKWPRRLLLRYPSLPLALHDSGSPSLFKEDFMELPRYNDWELAEKLEEFPCPKYLIETASDLDLHSRIDNPAIRGLWTTRRQCYSTSTDGGYSLNADIQEYQPVTSRTLSSSQRPLQYPSIYDASYEKDLFPYMNMGEGPLQPDHATASCLPHVINQNFEQPLQVSPVFINPPELYYNFENKQSSWKNHQDHTPRKAFSTQKTLAFLDKWLCKIYNPRSNDFIDISSTSHKIDTMFHNIHQNFCATQMETRAAGTSDSKYDLLEREALEQYSNTDTTLTPQKGSIRSSTGQHYIHDCSPSKQAMLFKKKKKSENKKRNPKHENKSLVEHSRSFTESETTVLDKFIELHILFVRTFNKSDWNMVQPLLTHDVSNIFQNCLKMIQQCSEWFEILIVRKDLKENFRTNKKRLELVRNIVNSQYELLNLLDQYINCYSRIKTTIPFDSRLFRDPDKCHNHKSIASVTVKTTSQSPSVPIDEYVQIFSEIVPILNSKVLDKFIFHSSPEDLIKREWKLTHIFVTQVNTNFYCIQIKKKKGRFHYILDQTKTSVPLVCKMVHWLDDHPWWCSWQWMYTDGWKFNDDDIFFTFNWLHQFRVTSLERAASSIRALFFYQWLLNFIVFSNEKEPKLKLLWDVANSNSVNSRVTFLSLLVKCEEGWCFSELRLSKFACALWNTSCNNICCFSWVLNEPSQTKKEIMPNLDEFKFGENEANIADNM